MIATTQTIFYCELLNEKEVELKKADLMIDSYLPTCLATTKSGRVLVGTSTGVIDFDEKLKTTLISSFASSINPLQLIKGLSYLLNTENSYIPKIVTDESRKLVYALKQKTVTVNDFFNKNKILDSEIVVYRLEKDLNQLFTVPYKKIREKLNMNSSDKNISVQSISTIPLHISKTYCLDIIMEFYLK